MQVIIEYIDCHADGKVSKFLWEFRNDLLFSQIKIKEYFLIKLLMSYCKTKIPLETFLYLLQRGNFQNSII
jgi:hypothetical protein